MLEENFVLEPFWLSAGDVEGNCYLGYIAANPEFELSVRSEVHQNLLQAQEFLPSGWQIVIKAGYRPLEVQKQVLRAFIEQATAQHPSWSDEELLQHARTFVVDPDIICPPHTTGGAIDVTVKGIDFGSPVNEDSPRSYLWSDAVSREAQANRNVLLRAMLRAGFAPNPNEWWHYQYGETYWAVFYGQTSTKYDIIR